MLLYTLRAGLMKRWLIFDLPLAPVSAILEFATSSDSKGPWLDCSLGEIYYLSCSLAVHRCGIIGHGRKYHEAHNRHVFNIRSSFAAPQVFTTPTFTDQMTKPLNRLTLRKDRRAEQWDDGS